MHSRLSATRTRAGYVQYFSDSVCRLLEFRFTESLLCGGRAEYPGYMTHSFSTTQHKPPNGEGFKIRFSKEQMANRYRKPKSLASREMQMTTTMSEH